MRNDFDAIPDAPERRAGGETALSRVYHDIGLAAVAEALDLLTAEFDPDLTGSLERGEFYLLPSARLLAQALAVA